MRYTGIIDKTVTYQRKFFQSHGQFFLAETERRWIKKRHNHFTNSVFQCSWTKIQTNTRNTRYWIDAWCSLTKTTAKEIDRATPFLKRNRDI